MKFNIEYKDGVFFIKASGPFKREGVVEYMKELFGHPQWKKGSLLLADYRNLKKNWSNYETFDTAGMAASEIARYRDSIEGTRIAAIYSPDADIAVDFGVYELLLEKLDVKVERKVFNDVDMALKWLRSRPVPA